MCRHFFQRFIPYPIFILFYFICYTIITKNKGKERKKRGRGELTETIGAYERLIILIIIIIIIMIIKDV